MTSTSPHTVLPIRICTGNDLVPITRIARMVEVFGPRVLTKFLSTNEHVLFRERFPQTSDEHRLPPTAVAWLAGRIAAKEAFAKALGCGLNGLGYTQGLRWTAITVAATPRGKPTLQVDSEPLAPWLATLMANSQWDCAISHDGGLVLATVVGLVASSVVLPD